MTALTTTLNRIRSHSPCEDGWRKLLKHLGKTAADDEPLPYTVILDSNGLDDALWCCRAEPRYSRLWRHFAVDCAEAVAHLLTDERSREAIRVARRFASGHATRAELAAASAAAWAAAWDARAAAGAASDAASAATWDAAWTASAAAWDARAASTAASAAERDAAWAAQSARFRTLCETGKRVRP